MIYMKTDASEKIVYSMNVNDLQEVSRQVIERPLTKMEIVLIGESVGEYVDWFQAVESAIRKHISE